MWACPCVYTHETNVTSLQLRFTTVLPTTLTFLRGTSAPARYLVPARARSELRLHSIPLSSELGLVFLVVRRQARDRDEVDAVPVTFGVGQVVPQVRPVDRDRLAVAQHAHVRPDDLLVAEARPAVRLDTWVCSLGTYTYGCSLDAWGGSASLRKASRASVAP